MPDYSVFLLNEEGRIYRSMQLEAGDDTAALKQHVERWRPLFQLPKSKTKEERSLLDGTFDASTSPSFLTTADAQGLSAAVKRNDGKSIHAQCGAHGYRDVAPGVYRAPPAPRPAPAHGAPAPHPRRPCVRRARFLRSSHTRRCDERCLACRSRVVMMPRERRGDRRLR